MKIVSPKIVVCGMEPVEQYIGVSSDTGVFASTQSVRVTGVEQASIVEVRGYPSKSIKREEDQLSQEAARSSFFCFE